MPFQQSNLGVAEHDSIALGMLLKAHQALVACFKSVTQPHAAYLGGAHLGARQAQFVRHTLRAVRWKAQCVVENLLLDLVTERGMTASQAARDLGIAPNIVSRWVREAGANKKQAFPGRGQMKADDAEVARLKRELAKTKAERDILKKLSASSRRSRHEIFLYCEVSERVWPVRWLSAALEVTCAGFYAWLKRPQSTRVSVDAMLSAAIQRSFSDSDRTYGARRVRRDLLHWGLHCGIHRVERLMRRSQLVARRRRRRMPFDVGLRAEHSIAPNVLERRFDVITANSKLVADFTYLWTMEGWLYVAVVMDLFSRRVVGWSMSSQMTAQLVSDAMLMAIWRRGPVTALLHHSDQGSQYTSEQFQRLLKEHSVTCSTSRSGDCWDNAAMESFFSTLKTELTSQKNYQSRDEARADVFDYIERFYNPRRRHSTLGYLSPVDYEKMAHSG